MADPAAPSAPAGPAGTILDCDRLQALLPHRYPLLMLDRVRLLPDENRAIGLKNVTMNEPHFQGHFPGNPVMPGVLMLEAILQTGAAALRAGLVPEGDLAFLLALDRVKFRKPVVPGHRLMTDVRVERARDRIVRGRATASVQDQRVCEAEFTLGLPPDPARHLQVTDFDPPLAAADVSLPAVPLANTIGVMNIIPHRYPFILVDAIYYMDDTRVIGVKNVTGNEPYFNGHFRQVPIMPGTLLVEAMAQVGATFILSKPENKGKLGFFMGVESARFRRPVRPGDQLLIDVSHTAARPRVGKASGRIWVGRAVVAEADISFVIVDRPAAT